MKTLAVFDDGSGPQLYAGGAFGIAGVTVLNSFARWDGADWSSVGADLGWPVVLFPEQSIVNSLTVVDEGKGPTLFVGGRFLLSPAGDGYLSRWGCP